MKASRRRRPRVPLKSMCRTAAFYWRPAPTIPRTHDRWPASGRAVLGARARPGPGRGLARRSPRSRGADHGRGLLVAHDDPPVRRHRGPHRHRRASASLLPRPSRRGRPSPATPRPPCARLSLLLGPGRGAGWPIFFIARWTVMPGEAVRGRTVGTRSWPRSSSPSTPTRSDTAVTSRMYALGVALAGLTAWLMLRALRARAPRRGLVGGLCHRRGCPLLHALLRRVHRGGAGASRRRRPRRSAGELAASSRRDASRPARRRPGRGRALRALAARPPAADGARQRRLLDPRDGVVRRRGRARTLG